MSRKVTKIPQTKQYVPIEDQRLRVAAYCRVSTRHEEQQHSLAAQTSYYTNYIQNHPNWVLVAAYSDTEPIIDQKTFELVQRMKGSIKKRQEVRQIEKPVSKMALE